MSSNHKKALERPRYFRGQLMTPEEMTLEQNYFLEKLRRHNRLLHGWGWVCGLEVNQHKEKDQNGDEQPVPWTVTISPGYAIDPLGNELFVPHTITFDLRRRSLSSCELVQGDADNPYRSDVLEEPFTDEEMYLAICYVECSSRPVRVTASGCNCENSNCEISRVKDGCCLFLINSVPEIYAEDTNKAICIEALDNIFNSCIVLDSVINGEPVHDQRWRNGSHNKIVYSQLGELHQNRKFNAELRIENAQLEAQLDNYTQVAQTWSERVAEFPGVVMQDLMARFNKEIRELQDEVQRRKNQSDALERKLRKALQEIDSLGTRLLTKKSKSFDPFDLTSVNKIGVGTEANLKEVGINNVYDLLIHTEDEVKNKLAEKKLEIGNPESIFKNAREGAEDFHRGREALEEILAPLRKKYRDD